MNTTPLQPPPGFARPDRVMFQGQHAPVVYAGFWIRFFAYLVDYFVLWLFSFVGILIITIGTGAGGNDVFGSVAFLALILVSLLYFPLFNASAWQATPGKRLLGIHLMRVDGQDISFLRAIGRHLSEILSALIFMIGYLMVGLTREKTGLHDLIAGTRVVYGRKG
ncbi:MAG: RDD family protein [Salinarimonas sp.]|nr:RDD family protein [Salinarimonas sp.]